LPPFLVIPREVLLRQIDGQRTEPLTLIIRISSVVGPAAMSSPLNAGLPKR
jgi:hypothetical protein